MFNATKSIDAEVFVVDNNSVDGSVEMVREKFPNVHLIANKDNLGFSKANNQAMRIAKGEYILLLNPDTVVEEETFTKCCDFMDDHLDAGGLGVKMVDGSGNFLSESKRALPTPEVAFYKIFGLSKFFPRSKKFGKYHLGYLDENETHEIEILAGAFMLMRKKALDKVGLLDEDYFMYGEDIDLSWRLIKGGYKNYYYPHTRIIHYKGESTKRTSVNYVFVFYGAMVIFAKKHFSSGSANLFAFLIHTAIYLKAGIDISKSLVKKLFHPLVDFLLIFSMMFVAKEYWQDSFKPHGTDFPPEYINVVVPLYLLIFLVVNHLSGGNDQPYKLSKILRGTIIATVLVSAFSNFFDEFRFSRSLILFSGIASSFVFYLTRFVWHYITYKTFRFSVEKEKRVALVGDKTECERVEALLKKLNISVSYMGYITPSSTHLHDSNYLGELRQLNEVINIHKIDELIFCSKDIPAQQVIEYMITTPNVEFKTVPDNSNYIIGSNSKNRPGDYYTMEVKFNLTEKASERNKRVFDFSSALLLLLLSPIVVLVMRKKSGFFKNVLQVLFGKKTWVGFSDVTNSTLPRIKNGVLKTHYTDSVDIDVETHQRLDLVYAKDYTVLNDVEIFFKSFSRLGG